MLMIFRYLSFILMLLPSPYVFGLESNWSNGIESQIRLISPLSKNNNQNEIYLGLEYQLNDGWKTYWQSPGEGGFPQNIRWNKSNNIKSLDILWPTPSYFEILGIQSIGYTEKVIFPLKIILENNLKKTFISLDINYLTCKDICIPGKAKLELLIPPGPADLTSYSYILEKNLSSLPLANLELSFINDINTEIFTDNNLVYFKILAEAKNFFKKPSIFLHTKYGLPVVLPQIKLNSNSKSFEAIFTFDKNLIKDKKIKTKFIITDTEESFLYSQEIQIKNKKIIFNNNYFYILIIAFLGGLILNVMPCVLPVISIKLLTMLDHLHNKNSIRKSFLVTSLGIISSFMIICFCFIILKEIGVNIGWGMQFQQPYFLIAISLILFFFSANLFGSFEIPIPKILNSKRFQNIQFTGYARDFFSGFFVTILATPCSAPLVGTAITAAFTQSSLMMFFIFLFMSFGMSFPFIIISIFPKLLNFLPKPGMWMIYVKYFLGLLLFLTFLWILNILSNHLNLYFFILYISILVLFWFTIKFLKFKKTFLFITIPLFFYFSNFSSLQKNYIKIDDDWIDFNLININQLMDEDNIIFVDITADWCATCQYNKINVLNSQVIKKYFSEYNVIKVRGDWTKPSEQIQKFLNNNNKYGIPFNIIYSKKNPQGIPLSEILSGKEIIRILKKQ